MSDFDDHYLDLYLGHPHAREFFESRPLLPLAIFFCAGSVLETVCQSIMAEERVDGGAGRTAQFLVGALPGAAKRRRSVLFLAVACSAVICCPLWRAA